MEFTDQGRKTTQLVSKDGVIYSLGDGGSANEHRTLLIDSTVEHPENVSHANAWQKVLLYLPGAKQRWETLPELLRGAKTTSASQAEVGG